MSTGWSYTGASICGPKNIQRDQKCQDNHYCGVIDSDESTFLAVVCDGAGSAKYARLGSYIASRKFKHFIFQFVNTHGFWPGEEELKSCLDELRDLVSFIAGKNNLELRDFASTLVFALSNSQRLLCGHIGDGGVVYKPDCSDEWKVASWPQNGQYASETFFFTDNDSPPFRINVIEEPIGGLAVFSDGVECVSLNLTDHQAHSPFFDAMYKPVLSSCESGRSIVLQKSLANFLSSDRFSERSDDDKSLIISAYK